MTACGPCADVHLKDLGRGCEGSVFVYFRGIYLYPLTMVGGTVNVGSVARFSAALNSPSGVKRIAMRKYDNVDYRFRSSDAKSEKAVETISGILGFLPDTNMLEYDLNFFSGGIGVDDRLAFSCAVAPDTLEVAVRNLRLVSPEEALSDPVWAEDFIWLVKHQGDATSIRLSSANFINSKRRPFQSQCNESLAMFFAQQSDVNTWTAVWVSENKLNYLYADQG